MKVKIIKLFKKLIIVFYVVTVITSFYSMYITDVKASEDNSLDGVLFIGDSRLGGTIKSDLEGMGATVKQVDGSSPASGWISAVENGTGTISGNSSIKVALPVSDNVKAVAIDLGVNNLSSINDYKTLVSKLKSKYSGVPIYLMSIYYLGTNRSGYSSMNDSIATYNSDLKNYASGDVKYVDVNNGLHDGKKLKDSYQDGEGIHLGTSEGKEKFVSNIKSKISTDGSGSDDSGSNAQKTVSEASSGVAEWAKSFYKSYGSRLTYSWRGDVTYNRVQVHDFSTEEFQNKLNSSSTLYVDCVGWVALAWHRGSGIDMWTSRYNGGSIIGSCYNMPTSYVGDLAANEYFKDYALTSPSQLIPGDILVSFDEHVALYVGDFDDNGTTKNVLEMGRHGLTANAMSGCSTSWSSFEAIVRLISYDGVTWDGLSGLDGSGGSYDTELINLDTVQKKLKFSGLPKTITYSGSKSFPDIFEFIKGLLDWLVGLLFLGLKIFAMGITEICENIVNNLMHSVSNVTITISTSN